jgi:hypothetical protein
MQAAADSKVGKSMCKDNNERIIAQMVYDGYIQFDFGYTAYATNAYLKATAQASLLLQGALAICSQQYCSLRSELYLRVMALHRLIFLSFACALTSEYRMLLR